MKRRGFLKSLVLSVSSVALAGRILIQKPDIKIQEDLKCGFYGYMVEGPIIVDKSVIKYFCAYR